MSMTITYELGNSLYINITNRCTNRCSFCVRNYTTGLGDGLNLWLEREPTVAEVLADIQKRDIAKYKELVFCGYGEPMIRADDVLEICKKLKENCQVPIRINTNGHANLIYGRDITPLLKGLADSISISLNAKNAQGYQKICQSEFGEKAYDAVLDFTAKVKKYVPKVILSVVDVIPAKDIEACREIARRLGADFRIR
jgi:radical SAM enzyme (TIGR04100 family)